MSREDSTKKKTGKQSSQELMLSRRSDTIRKYMDGDHIPATARKYFTKHRIRRSAATNTWERYGKSAAVDLANLDDLSTRLLIDPYLCFKTHKMNIGNHPGRFDIAPNDTTLKNLVNKFQQTGDYHEAYKDLNCFINSRDLTTMEIGDLCFHLLAYLMLLDPKYGFEIQRCTRYTGDKKRGGGAKIVTTQIREKGQDLCIIGLYAPLTTEQLKKLIVPANSYSIKISNQDQTQQLYLGPAAFVNHSCDPNCVEIYRKDGPGPGFPYSYLQALRAIDEGEEITINYGPTYFKPGECGCKRCKPDLWPNEQQNASSNRTHNLRRTAARFLHVNKNKHRESDENPSP